MLVRNMLTGIIILFFSILILNGCKGNNDKSDKIDDKKDGSVQLFDAKEIADSSISPGYDNIPPHAADEEEFD